MVGREHGWAGFGKLTLPRRDRKGSIQPSVSIATSADIANPSSLVSKTFLIMPG